MTTVPFPQFELVGPECPKLNCSGTLIRCMTFPPENKTFYRCSMCQQKETKEDKMKFKLTNKLFQLFVVDPLPKDTSASYECDPDAPRVIVDAKSMDRSTAISPPFRIEEGVGNALLHPVEFSSEEEFNHIGIQAILKAWELVKNEASSLEEVKKQFADDDNKMLSSRNINAILIGTENRTISIHYVSKFCMDNYAKLFIFPEIPSGFAYCLPEPEFFGVIPLKTLSNEEQYAIGIINSRPIVKVYIGEPNNPNHWYP